ncbi:MAG: hypothetical protein ACR2P1_03595 [Pseudomonadales bacterium]
MSVKSERITILGSPEFKAFLAAEAAKEGVSVSELVRTRCERPAATNGATEDVLLAELTKELRAATQRAGKALDRGMKKANAVLKRLDQEAPHAQ